MLKGRNFIRDFVCLIMLLALVRFNVRKQYIKHMSTKTMVKHATKIGLEKITDAVSDTFTKIGKITRRKNRDEKPLPQKAADFAGNATTLLQQIEKTQTALEKDELLDQDVKDIFAKKIKSLHSRVEHLKKEAIKDPAEARFLTGPLGATAQVVHERSLDKKLFEATTQTGLLLTEIAEERGNQIPKVAIASLEQGLDFNNTLLS